LYKTKRNFILLFY